MCPLTPHNVYKHDGWQGWGHWLGTGNVGVKKDHQFLPFKKALLYARSLKLKGVKKNVFKTAVPRRRRRWVWVKVWTLASMAPYQA